MWQEKMEKLAVACETKKWPFPWPGSMGWKPHVMIAAPLEEPKLSLPPATIKAEQELMEKETGQFMDGRSNRGDWVMQNRTTGGVENFDRMHICKDRTRDWVLVHRQAVKHKAQPEYLHSLYTGEKVEFVKALSHKGF